MLRCLEGETLRVHSWGGPLTKISASEEGGGGYLYFGVYFNFVQHACFLIMLLMNDAGTRYQ